MKKLIVGAFATALLFPACRKDYVCECTYQDDSTTFEVRNVKPKDSEEACNTGGETWIAIGGTCKVIEE